MLNWQRGKNRIFVKLAAFIMAQVFFITSLGYAGWNSNYLRVPVGQSKDRVLRVMQLTDAFASKEIILNMPSAPYTTKETMYSAMIQVTENVPSEAGGYYYKDDTNWRFVVTVIGDAESIALEPVTDKQITGFWHTHGDGHIKEQGIPSESDLLLMLARPGQEAVIISRAHKRIIELRKTWSRLDDAPLAKAWTTVNVELMSLDKMGNLRQLIGELINFRLGIREPFINLSIRPLLGLFQDELGSENYSKDTWIDVAKLFGIEVRVGEIQDEGRLGGMVYEQPKAVVVEAVAQYGKEAAQYYLDSRVWKIVDEILRDLVYCIPITNSDMLPKINRGIKYVLSYMPKDLYLNRLSRILDIRIELMKIISSSHLDVNALNIEIDKVFQLMPEESEQYVFMRWLTVVLLDRLIRVLGREQIESVGIVLLNSYELETAPIRGIRLTAKDLMRFKDGEIFYENIKKQWESKGKSVVGVVIVDLNKLGQFDPEAEIEISSEQFLVSPIKLYVGVPYTKSIFAMGDRQHGRITNAIVRIAASVEAMDFKTRGLTQAFRNSL